MTLAIHEQRILAKIIFAFIELAQNSTKYLYEILNIIKCKGIIDRKNVSQKMFQAKIVK